MAGNAQVLAHSVPRKFPFRITEAPIREWKSSRAGALHHLAGSQRVFLGGRFQQGPGLASPADFIFTPIG
jgi:hypothetical protein